MSELLNNFRLGRMEKDLDDRLLINGSYRDALNVEVATSDGSDVGALQKVLGNTLISGLPALTNATCIGSVRDTQNNKIYWFITSNGADLIAEYDGTTIDLILVDTGATAKVNNTTSNTIALVVDNNSGTIQVGDTLTGVGVSGDVTVTTVTNQNNLVLSSAQSLSDNTDLTFKSILKFNTSNLILGVNILDKVLYFTDNLNEPRQVDIEYWRGQTGTTLVTSTGLTADKITVIRKSPISSPTFSTISSATVTGPGTIDGDQILMKINNVLDLNLSSFTVGQVVPLITFIKVIDSSVVNTNFIVGTRFDSTSEEGYVVSFTVTAVDTSGSNHSFTAVVDSIDDRILPSDSNSFSVLSMPISSQKFIRSGASTQSNETALNNATILEINAAGTNTASRTQISVPATDTYNVTFNIKISQIDTTISRDVYAQLKKNGDDFGGQINWGSTPSTQQLVLNNRQLNQDDKITILVGEGNNQGTGPTGNINSAIFTVHADTNWSFVDASFFSGINSYTVVAKQEYGFFEDKFPRFSYRYKYSNGQYSGFAPFSKVAFIPGQFDYDTKNAYNLGMLNKINGLTLTGWNSDISARSISFVDEVDLLYKTSSDQNIYIVDTIKKVGGSIASVYDIKNEQIFKVVDSMQLLRSFDSVPLKAKAQEIVGNRLLYANYTENFNYTSTPEFLVSTNTRADTNPDDKFSVKSNRTYQLGIIFQDIYGRQTPVFTSNSGIFKIDLIKSNVKNQIITSLKTTPPTEATHYRYFIKETSLEYYNISVSNFYSDDEGFIYLSIPSSEINKVKTGDYLNLKKKNGVNEYFYSKDNKHKVLGVDGNPPDFLAKSKTTTHFAKYVEFCVDFATTIKQTTKKPNLTPVESYNTIQLRTLHDTAIGGFIGTDSLAFLKEGALLRFVKGDFSTKTYEIKSVAVTDDSNKTAEVSFTKPFGKEVVHLYLDNTNNSFYDGIGIEFITETNSLGNPNYTNKSFIKLNESTLLGAGLLDSINENDLSISASAYIKSEVEANERDFYVKSSVNLVLTIITQKAYNDAESKYSNSIFANSLVKGKYIRISDSSFYNFGTNKTLFKIKSITETVGTFDGVANRKKYVITLDKNLSDNGFATTGGSPYFSSDVRIDILSINNDNTSDLKSPCIFEVEPEEGLLDIYYDTDEVHPISLLRDDNSPVATARIDGSVSNLNSIVIDNIITGTISLNMFITHALIKEPVYITSITQNSPSTNHTTLGLSSAITIIDNQVVSFHNSTSLKYSNCISFGNGVESDRIRDDFNAPTIGKGVRASAVFEDNYGREEKTNSFIYSQIYNSSSGVNRLNQFIIADKITKDINPSHGSIQLIKTRDTDLIALCEDKCFRVQANKDALFTADGNAQVVASSNVLGQVIPYVGEYGISKNPESFAQYGFRAYFTDRERGVVLRLSRDGLSEISAMVCLTFFSDKLANVTSNVFGSYDDRKNSYNLSFTNQANSDPTETISFNERVNGWTSRKSFVPETAISLNNDYFSFKAGSMYKHHSNTETNDFYTDTTALLSQATSYEYEITLTQSNSDIAVGMYVSGETIPSGVTVSSLSGGYFISTNNLVIPSGTTALLQLVTNNRKKI